GGQEFAGFSVGSVCYHDPFQNLFLATSAGAAATVGVAASSGSWHAVQGVFNDTSSVISVDGAATTGLSAGTFGASNQPIMMGGPPAFSNYFTGSMAEMGIWASAFNSTQYGNMYANQHNYYSIV